jgi:hypothetical protein
VGGWVCDSELWGQTWEQHGGAATRCHLPDMPVAVLVRWVCQAMLYPKTHLLFFVATNCAVPLPIVWGCRELSYSCGGNQLDPYLLD